MAQIGWTWVLKTVEQAGDAIPSVCLHGLGPTWRVRKRPPEQDSLGTSLECDMALAKTVTVTGGNGFVGRLCRLGFASAATWWTCSIGGKAVWWTFCKADTSGRGPGGLLTFRQFCCGAVCVRWRNRWRRLA